MRTFDHDYTLPALPVPELKNTCLNLKKLIRPLVGRESFDEASKALDAFAENQGVKLQKLLLQMADSDAANASWLRPIWDDMYLSFRGMLPVNMNYTFQFVGGRWGEDELPVLISALAQTINKMRTESLPPEPAREGFLSMDAVAGMIYTRIPGRVRDTWYYPSLSYPMTASVVCKGHWFILSLVDRQGACLSPASITSALTEIRRQSASMGPAPFVGAMTCLNRALVLKLRELFRVYPQNRMNLERMEKSVFTVCLDEPLGEQENFNLRLLAGPPENRWFDKSLQIIGDGNNLGMNFEHSGCDAGIWVYLLNQAEALLMESSPHKTGQAHILPLNWNIPEDLADKLKTAAERYRTVMKKLNLSDRRISGISQERIKTMKCSPDSFVQLLYQTAYYKLTGHFRSVYEAVSTRNFYQGRTECVRPVTEESVAFVRAFCKKRDHVELTEKFHMAINAHGESIRLAQKALGPERHMVGLATMAQIHGISLPDIFSTEGYRTLRHDTLSTSSITAPYINFFSFGPVVEDGIGIGYIIKSDALHVAVSTYQDSGIDPDNFIYEMEQAAQVFYHLPGCNHTI